ncbi:MAG: septum formation initiator family protein [Actinomycetota bacterium]
MPRHATTSIPRPTRRGSDEGRSRLGDYTRPIPLGRRISARRRVPLIVGAIALAVIATLALAVFISPIGTWREQDADLEQRRVQYEELRRVNADLEAEVDRLRTDEGVRESAREDYGYVEAGEERLSVTDLPGLPTDLPDGWPYNVVTSIIAATAAGPAPAPVVEPAPVVGGDAGGDDGTD